MICAWRISDLCARRSWIDIATRGSSLGTYFHKIRQIMPNDVVAVRLRDKRNIWNKLQICRRMKGGGIDALMYDSTCCVVVCYQNNESREKGDSQRYPRQSLRNRRTNAGKSSKIHRGKATLQTEYVNSTYKTCVLNVKTEMREMNDRRNDCEKSRDIAIDRHMNCVTTKASRFHSLYLRM